MTQLFAALFFITVLVVGLAYLAELWMEYRPVILAALPWTSTQIVPTSTIITANVLPPAVPRRREERQPYWATPSISSDTPAFAITVSPATVR